MRFRHIRLWDADSGRGFTVSIDKRPGYKWLAFVQLWAHQYLLSFGKGDAYDDLEDW